MDENYKQRKIKLKLKKTDDYNEIDEYPNIEEIESFEKKINNKLVEEYIQSYLNEYDLKPSTDEIESFKNENKIILPEDYKRFSIYF